MSQDVLIQFTASFLVWNVLNYIVMSINLPDKHLKRDDMLDMRNRMVSLSHGLTMVFMGGYHFYFIHTECGQKMSDYQRSILVISCGYFTYDLVAMWYYGLLDKAMLIHHGMCQLGMLGGLEAARSTSYLIDALFVTEISNPMMHGRMVLKYLGLRYTKAYEVSELTYISKHGSPHLICVVLYIYGRLLLGTTMCLRCLACDEASVFIKIAGTAIVL